MTQVHCFAGVAQSKPWIAYCAWFRPIHGQHKLRLLTNINILSFSSAPKFTLPQQTSLGKCIYEGKIANGMVGRSITSFQKQTFVLGTVSHFQWQMDKPFLPKVLRNILLACGKVVNILPLCPDLSHQQDILTKFN
jgi:hypothetical protein